MDATGRQAAGLQGPSARRTVAVPPRRMLTCRGSSVGSGGLISGSLSHSHSPHESDLSSSQSQCALRQEARSPWCLPAAASIIEY